MCGGGGGCKKGAARGGGGGGGGPPPPCRALAPAAQRNPTDIFRIRLLKLRDRAPLSLGGGRPPGTRFGKAQQNRTEQNRQKLKNRKNIQEQTKPYLQNKQLILACGSRARQRLPDDGQKCDMESQVGHFAINRPDKAHQSLIYYARAHTHARSAKMTKNMAVLRSL